MNLTPMNIDELIIKANASDIEAQFNLGSYYYNNQEFAEAAHWFEHASREGHVQAQFNLAYIYQLEERAEGNQKLAKYWYEQAASQGLASAQNNLANILQQEGNLELAFDWYKRAAEQDYGPAEASLAFAYSQGRGTKANENEAFNYYKRASEKGIAAAQSNLGLMYAQGRGTNVDSALAVHWVKSSADQGYSSAEFFLGDFYGQGFGVDQNPIESLRWFRRAATHGFSEAQKSLARYYRSRSDNLSDHLIAFMWFSVVSRQGFWNDEIRLDFSNLDPESNMLKLISHAIEGEIKSQRELAVKLTRGEEITQDEDAARYWLEAAARGGDPWSQTTLSLLLKNSEFIWEKESSVYWLKEAVKKADDRARFNLGLWQVLGEGVEINLISASINLIQASLAGFSEARAALEVLEEHIDSAMWEKIIDQVKWSDLMFIFGPFPEGHLNEIRLSQSTDDGNENAEWFLLAKESANSIFLPSNDNNKSILNSSFGQDVTIKKIHVGRTHLGNEVFASVTINLADIHLQNMRPVYWNPSEESLRATASLIGFIDGRSWIRTEYISY
jgi:TPR repeat protein